MNFHDYYVNQAGTGIATYSGFRYQKGHGFFGRMIKGSILPLIKKVLPYLKDQLIDTGKEFGRNIMTSDDFKTAAKKTAKRKIGDIASDALERVKTMTQEGSGFNTCGLPIKRGKRMKKMRIGVSKKRVGRVKRRSPGKQRRKRRKTPRKTPKKGPRKSTKKAPKSKRKNVYKRKTVDMAYVRSFRGKNKKSKSRKKHLENF